MKLSSTQSDNDRAAVKRRVERHVLKGWQEEAHLLTRKEAQKKFVRGRGEFEIDKGAINIGVCWLIVSRISASSSTDRAVVDPVSCRLGASAVFSSSISSGQRRAYLEILSAL